MKSSKKKPAKSRKDIQEPKKAGHVKSTVLGLYGGGGMLLSLLTLFTFRLPFADLFLRKYWRHALASLLIIVASIAGMVYTALQFLDAEDIKQQTLEYVRTIKQRELKIDGEISLSFFPSLALEARQVSLSERNSKQIFATIDNARLDIAWWPLLLRQVRVKRVVFEGLKAQLVRHKDGSTNFDDLLASDGKLANIRFELDQLRMFEATLNLLDQTSNARLVLSRVHVETGLIQDGEPSEFKAGFHLHSAKDKADADVSIRSQLVFDRTAKRYQFPDFQAQARGRGYGVTNVELDLHAQLAYHPESRRFESKGLNAQLKGVRQLRPLSLQFDAAALALDHDRLSGSSLAVQGRSVQGADKRIARLELPQFSMTGGQLHAPQAVGDLEWANDKRQLTVHLTTPLTWTSSSRELHLSSFQATLGVAHPALVSSVQAQTRGSLRTSWAEQSALLDFHAKLDDSRFAGKFQLRNFSQPSYSFDIGVDTLDLDRYLAIDWPRRWQADAPAFDFSALRGLQASGRLHSSGELRLARLRMSQFASEVRLDKSGLQLDALQATLYGGTAYGSATLALGKQPRLQLRQKLDKVQLHALLGDLAAGEARLLGSGTLALDLQADASSPAMLRKTLSGHARLALGRGSLQGIDLGAVLLARQAQLGSAGAEHSETAQPGASTAFNELTAAFEISRSRARNTDLRLRAPGFSVQGEGESDLSNGQIGYRLQTDVERRARGSLAPLAGVSVPARLRATPERSELTLLLGEATGLKATKSTAAPTPARRSRQRGKRR